MALAGVGVRADEISVALGLRVVGDERAAVWQALLDDVTGWGSDHPALLIEEGRSNADPALEVAWTRRTHHCAMCTPCGPCSPSWRGPAACRLCRTSGRSPAPQCPRPDSPA